MKSPRTALSLIEVLVVTAVIAAIAGIVTPIYLQGKAKANQAHCLSNIRQWTVAQLLYVEDTGWFATELFNEGAPLPVSGSYSHTNWIRQLAPYKTHAKLRCPSYSASVTPDWQRPGYAINGCLYRTAGHKQIYNFDEPTSVVLLTEVTDYFEKSRGEVRQFTRLEMAAPDITWLFRLNFYGTPNSAGALGPPAATRHFGNCHYAFIDSHTKSLRPNKIFVPEGYFCHPVPGWPRSPSTDSMPRFILNKEAE